MHKDKRRHDRLSPKQERERKNREQLGNMLEKLGRDLDRLAVEREYDPETDAMTLPHD